ncbi:Lpg1974 family pore-forming outer membrane protein [Legionella nagasakiensis]|uniref:Lpg1974 family pore-forming outer membrane protein n=1 Tax=Legionella nagasakiensis TaxID=535290 RepID=UPI0013EF952D|nr:Lpg1974 family pore-forming outer membrane protein [Legionella nagasakiensis]
MKYRALSFCLVSLFLGFSSSSSFAKSSEKAIPLSEKGKVDVHASLLYLQPTNNDLKYSVFVFNTQPYSQDWAYQVLNPPYAPAFELGADYSLYNSPYNASIDWLHLNTSTSASKQADPAVSLVNVEFVAPPYDVGPAVFGIKHASSTVKIDFDNIALQIGRLFTFDEGTLQARLFSGINILNLNQTVTTTFSDFPGALPTSVTYGLAPDPTYSFQTKNTSKYLGAGPDFGLQARYHMKHGFSVVTQAQGMLTVGTIRSSDHFTSTSRRLTEVGIPVSKQWVDAPTMTQVVPAFDAKLGLAYQWSSKTLSNLTVELGYRVASYINAISNVGPATLVQVGDHVATPEFATGTMAIQSTDTRQSTLSLNGPYLDFKLKMMG